MRRIESLVVTKIVSQRSVTLALERIVLAVSVKVTIVFRYLLASKLEVLLGVIVVFPVNKTESK